jgi:regulatory protein
VKITLLPKENKRLILTIYVEEEPWLDIHTKIFGRNLSLPSCDSLDQLQESFLTLEYSKAKKYALACLAMRSYPSSQLQKLLERNLVSSLTIQKILQEFSRLGYLNDREWIEGFIKAQMRRHTGAQAIVAKLMHKGISKKDAEQWKERLVEPCDVRKSLMHLLNTKYKKRDLSDFREKQKVFGALMRKGFDPQSIKDALNIDFDERKDSE